MPTPARAPSAGREGFSLAEILIVLVIMSLLTAMALPRIQGMVQVSSIEGGLNGVATDLAVARMRAIRTARRVTTTISADGKSYTIVVDPAGTPTTLKTVAFSTNYPGLELTPHSAVISFDSRGMTSGTTSTLTASRGGHSATLTISGVGRIYRGY
ncbi:GspH/FimT family pseudopilin [Longimicrobium sp.]|uniref:GspH/FimT family pseudopilin n=1 Tax=Longimicrobium sp. TaxID=2029185 RepID=UPI002D1C77C6|nr:GspH/FimT family pseudopilin [Longimicrobium sp.]HSU13193.1 GspH/FimT family pseudopilin [Longimicrobium sp.]